jgi:hypothetical protein
LGAVVKHKRHKNLPIPPSPRSAKHQGLAHANDFAQLKKRRFQKTEAAYFVLVQRSRLEAT